MKDKWFYENDVGYNISKIAIKLLAILLIYLFLNDVAIF